MNIYDILILSVIALALTAAVISMIRRKKSGKLCCGNCSSCSACTKYQSKQNN